MLQTLDAIPEIFAMMVLSSDRNDIFYWIEARSPVNLEEVRIKNSNRQANEQERRMTGGI
jgi:hypothetical protein